MSMQFKASYYIFQAEALRYVLLFLQLKVWPQQYNILVPVGSMQVVHNYSS